MVLVRLTRTNIIAVAGIAIIMIQGNLLFKSHQIHNAFRSTSTVWEREQQQQQQQQSLFDNEFPLPKVVILPGPHKTGSSSIQGCMASWTWTELSRTAQLPVVLSNWSWAVPTHENMVRAGLAHPSPIKGFASFVGVADLDPTLGLSPQARNESGDKVTIDKVQQVVDMFRSRMDEAWRDGYSLIYGSEEMDRLLNPIRNLNSSLYRPRDWNSSVLMDAILNILPWENGSSYINDTSFNNANVTQTSRTLQLDDLEVVVVHRTPRVKHIISVWHQTGYKENETFHAFLTNQFRYHAHVTSSLGLARQFLERKIRTTIVDDFGSVHGNRTNLCHVLACDVLRDEECTQNHRLSSLESPGSVDVSNMRLNEQTDDAKGVSMMDLTLEQLTAVDRVMQEYDCGFWESLGWYSEQSLLRILYKNDIFARCENDGKSVFPERSLDWMVENILHAIS